jgi:hypothetical protein
VKVGAVAAPTLATLRVEISVTPPR